VFFDRKEFVNVVREIGPPDGDRAAHPGERAATASPAPGEVAVPSQAADSSPQVPDQGSVVRVGRPSKLRKRIRALERQVRLEGFVGREKELYEAIRQKFTGRKPHVRTIQRALKFD
jgi:hypothetical protein